jgi:hypothetical protein
MNIMTLLLESFNAMSVAQRVIVGGVVFLVLGILLMLIVASFALRWFGLEGDQPMIPPRDDRPAPPKAPGSHGRHVS